MHRRADGGPEPTGSQFSEPRLGLLFLEGKHTQVLCLLEVAKMVLLSPSIGFSFPLPSLLMAYSNMMRNDYNL